MNQTQLSEKLQAISNQYFKDSAELGDLVFKQSDFAARIEQLKTKLHNHTVQFKKQQKEEASAPALKPVTEAAISDQQT